VPDEPPVVTWPGTLEEGERLFAALERNCTGEPDCVPQEDRLCPAHAMLKDQDALNHLFFVYRREHGDDKGKLTRGEFSESSEKPWWETWLEKNSDTGPSTA
jgi:hypothetical protein